MFQNTDTQKINIWLSLCLYQELAHSSKYKLNLVERVGRFSQSNGTKGHLPEASPGLNVPDPPEMSQNSQRGLSLLRNGCSGLCPFFFFLFLLIPRCSFYVLDVTPLPCVS